MKKVLNYFILFAAAFIVQWVWYSYIKPKNGGSLLDIFLTALVFTTIIFLLDLIPKKKIK
ncbi:MAG: hypothetical protein ACE3JK_04620 [Sporolactobacillus sp.]